MSVVESLVETQEFATLPPVAAKILSLLENDDVDIRDIVKILESDASLTLKLLRVANSPLYATRHEIATVQQAIVTLGLNRLTNIVIGVSIFSKFIFGSKGEASKFMEKFWWHSSCTGVVAKSLTLKIKKFFKENEFIGGLLHDIGKLAMLQANPDKYLQVINLIEEDNYIDVEAEEEIFQTNHLEVGAYIAKLWKLPEEISTVISNHSRLDVLESNRGLVSVIRFSDLLCEMWGAGINEGWKVINLSDHRSWEILCDEYPELKDLDFEKFTFELENDFKKSSEFLNVLRNEA